MAWQDVKNAIGKSNLANTLGFPLAVLGGLVVLRYTLPVVFGLIRGAAAVAKQGQAPAQAQPQPAPAPQRQESPLPQPAPPAPQPEPLSAEYDESNDYLFSLN